MLLYLTFFPSLRHGSGIKLETKWYLPLVDLRFHPPGVEGGHLHPSLSPSLLPFLYLPSLPPSLLSLSSSSSLPSLPPAALQPVPVTSDQELSVIKSRLAELKVSLSKDSKEKDRTSRTMDKDSTFVSLRHAQSLIH